MNPFSHVPEDVFEILNRWSYIHNLEVLILEMSNLTEIEKRAFKESITLILCNFEVFFATLKMEFARAELFINHKGQLGKFCKIDSLIKSLKTITKGLENLKFRNLFDLPKFFIKTYKKILIDFIEDLGSRQIQDTEFNQLSDALKTIKDTFIDYEKFCANFTCHLQNTLKSSRNPN